MSKNIKKPKQAASYNKIIPHESSSPPTNDEHPVFSLKDLKGDYCLTKCEQSEKAAFSVTLHKLSQMKWVEIINAPKYGLGSETIERAAIKAPIPSHIPKTTTFLAIRFDGIKPMVGYRKNEVFYVLFLDRDFTLYDH